MSPRPSFSRCAARTTLSIIPALSLASIAMAGGAGSFQVIFAPGELAPGLGDEVSFSFVNMPAINSAGQFVVGATIDGTGVEETDNYTLWRGGFNDLKSASIIARENDVAPGAPAGQVFNFFDMPLIADTGRVVFLGDRRPASSTVDGGIWAVEPNGDIVDFLLEGEQAVGAAAGDNYRTVIFQPYVGGGGDILYTGHAGFTYDGAWVGQPGAAQALAFENNPAPLPGEDVLFGNLVNPRAINGNGVVAIESFLQGKNVDPETQNLIWMGTPGNLSPAVREGDDAAGLTGFTINFPQLGGINDAGTVVYGASTYAPELTGRGLGFDDRGVWATDGETTTLIAFEGDTSPAFNEGESMYYPRFPLINGQGKVIMTTTLVGDGVTQGMNDTAIVIATPDDGRGAIDYAIAMRAGDPAPGIDDAFIYAPEGKFLGDFDYCFNGVGQAAIMTSLTGDNITFDNDEALYLYDPAIGLQLVAREGDPMPGDARGDDAPVITQIRFHDDTGGEDGRPRSLSDQGQFLARVQLSDGTWLVAGATIPAPAGTALLLLGASCMGARRRR